MSREYIPKRYNTRKGPSPDEIDDKYHFNGKGGGKYYHESYGIDEFYSQLKPIRKKPQEEKTRLMRRFFAREIDLAMIITALDLFGNRLPRRGDNPYDLVLGEHTDWELRRLKVMFADSFAKEIMRTFDAKEVVDMFIYKFQKVELAEHDKFTIMAMRGVAL